MGTEISIAKTFPYSFPIEDKVMVAAPSGVCDPAMSDTRERLAPWRVATGFFTGTIAGAGASITFANPQELLLFTAGPTDAATASGGGATGILSRSDTNAQSASDGGGAVRADQAFVATGVWFQWLQPYTVATGAAAIGQGPTGRTASAFLRSPVSPYSKIMQQMLSSCVNPGLKNGKQSACEFDLLSLDLWASGSGVADATIGFGGIGGAFYHLSTPEVSGGQGSGRELQISLKLDRTIIVESDAANPTPAGVDVICPIRCAMVGYPICTLPGTVAIDYDQLASAMQRTGGQPMGNMDYDALAAAMNRQKSGGRVY